MGIVVFALAVAALVWVWLRIARNLASQGSGWYLRNVVAGTVGMFAWLLVMIGGGVLGAFSSDGSGNGGNASPAATAAAADTDHADSAPATPPTRVPAHGPLIDGKVPPAVAEMFGTAATVDHGVLTVRISIDRAVTISDLSTRVSMLCMSRWTPPEGSDDTQATPVWAGVAEFRVINRAGWGLAFDGGDADCDAVSVADLDAHVAARSRRVFE